MKTKFNFDLYLRDKPGMTADEFVKRYCEVFRPFAYATQDDSINEFEKLICHVLGMLCYHRRRAELLGMDTDPRDAVRNIEEAMTAMEQARQDLSAAFKAATSSHAGEPLPIPTPPTT